MQTQVEIASAADENYAMPLAAMLASIQMHLDADSFINANLLSLGISGDSRNRIESTIDPNRMNVCWIDIDEALLKSLNLVLRAEDHISLASYARLLIPDLVSEETHRLIYLDCDVVCTCSIGDLWVMDLCGRPLLAAQETVSGVWSAGARGGIRAYRELRLPHELPLFNAGVMVLDLTRWREQRLAQQAFAYLRAARDYVRWHDQEAINVVLRGNWQALPSRWNFSTFQVASSGATHATQPALRPSIIHYNSETKPWHARYNLPFGEVFFEALDRTAWQGWRPVSHALQAQIDFSHRVKKALTKRYGNIRRLGALRRKKHAGLKILSGIDNSWPVLTNLSAGEIRAFWFIDELDEDLATHLQCLFSDGVDRVFVAIRTTRYEIAASIKENPRIILVASHDQPRDIVTRKMLYHYGSDHWCLLTGPGESVGAPELSLGSVSQVRQHLEENNFDALSIRSINDAVADRAQVTIQAIEQDSLTGALLSGPARIVASDDPSPQAIQYTSRTLLFRYRRSMSIARNQIIVAALNPAGFFGTIRSL